MPHSLELIVLSTCTGGGAGSCDSPSRVAALVFLRGKRAIEFLAAMAKPLGVDTHSYSNFQEVIATHYHLAVRLPPFGVLATEPV